MIKKILTVCVGNICRSPMAEAIFSEKLPEKHVHSAGIGALVNHPADPLARELMLSRGIDISQHRARQVDLEIILNSDIIFVMENTHKIFIENTFPSSRGKIFQLGHFQKLDIPDPYKQDKSAFEFSLKLIDQGIENWSTRIEKL